MTETNLLSFGAIADMPSDSHLIQTASGKICKVYIPPGLCIDGNAMLDGVLRFVKDPTSQAAGGECNCTDGRCGTLPPASQPEGGESVRDPSKWAAIRNRISRPAIYGNTFDGIAPAICENNLRGWLCDALDELLATKLEGK